MELRDKSIDELELSRRSRWCLEHANIRTLGELVVKTESEMLKIKNFGRKSLNEIKEELAGLGLRFGMSEDDDGSSIPVGRPNKPSQPSSGATAGLEDE